MYSLMEGWQWLGEMKGRQEQKGTSCSDKPHIRLELGRLGRKRTWQGLHPGSIQAGLAHRIQAPQGPLGPSYSPPPPRLSAPGEDFPTTVLTILFLLCLCFEVDFIVRLVRSWLDSLLSQTAPVLPAGCLFSSLHPPGDGLHICLTLFSRSWRRAKGLRLELPLPPRAPHLRSRPPLHPKGTRPSRQCPPPLPIGSPRAVGAPAAAPSQMRVSPPRS